MLHITVNLINIMFSQYVCLGSSDNVLITESRDRTFPLAFSVSVSKFEYSPRRFENF
jgi:hypothetical protein